MKNYCVRQEYTVKEVIEIIERNKDRVAIVMNLENKVIGIVSQGDIIRAIMAGINLYSRVDGIIRNDFLYLNDKDMKQAYRLFRKFKISLLPIVDEDFNLTDVIVLDDVYQYLEGK